jgi:hypothetical protein
MLTRDELIKKLKEQKPVLAKKFAVRTLGLFGSFARNEQKSSSDIDLIVDFDKPIGIDFVVLADEFEKYLDFKVDLVSKNAIKARYLKEFEKEIIYV